MSQLNINPRIVLARSLAETLYWSKRCYYDGHYGLLNFGIEDRTFDLMEEALEQICPGHPILNCVGSPKSDDVLIGIVETRKLIEALYDPGRVQQPKQIRPEDLRGILPENKRTRKKAAVLPEASVG